MRFKLLPIFAALLLLCGCGGARTLADVSGCGQWDRVQIIEWYEQGGSAGTQLPADSLSPDTLRELLGSTYVRRSYASMELPVPCVRTAAAGVKGYYPAFDMTPPHLISGIVTDRGVFSPFDLHRYFQSGGAGEYDTVV